MENSNTFLGVTFYWNHVELDSIEQLIKCLKLNSKHSWDYVLGRYLTIEDEEHEEYLQLLDEAKILWYDSNCTPFTVEEANNLSNQEQREIILSEIKKNK